MNYNTDHLCKQHENENGKCLYLKKKRNIFILLFMVMILKYVKSNIHFYRNFKKIYHIQSTLMDEFILENDNLMLCNYTIIHFETKLMNYNDKYVCKDDKNKK